MFHDTLVPFAERRNIKNIILGKESGGFFLDKKESRRKVEELVERFGFKIDLDEKIINLSVGMKQRVEILKTLYRGADIIILDEPTAVLTPQEVEDVVAKTGEVKGPVVLELNQVRLNKRTQETVSLRVRAGEILGIAGVDGNGQQELEEMIIGNRKVEEGEIKINGTPIQNLSVKARKTMGIGYIPSDRHKNAMVADFSITENFLLGYQENPRYVKKGLVNYKALEEDAKVQVEKFEIKVAGVEQHIGQLSGGNQQKVILGRETSHDPKFMLVAQPVRGLDIGAIERVHKTLLSLKEQGKAILLISAELSEVMNLSDRIAVLYEGEISAQFAAGTYTKEEIGLLYIFLWKTSVGFKLRAVGANASAAKTAGIKVNLYLVMSMTLSGGIAALAGITEIFGKYHRFIEGFSPSFGFTGIAVAILGRNHPAGVLLTSLLFGILDMGSLRMSRETAVSTNMVTVIQSLVILLVAAPELIKWSRKRRG